MLKVFAFGSLIQILKNYFTHPCVQYCTMRLGARYLELSLAQKNGNIVIFLSLAKNSRIQHLCFCFFLLINQINLIAILLKLAWNFLNVSVLS